MTVKSAVLFIALTCIAGAQSDPREGTLKGVGGMAVMIETLPTAAQGAGLSEKTLQTDVELRLRKAGVTVVGLDESLRIPGSPALYVQVGFVCFDPKLPMCASSIEVEFIQSVLLERDPSIVDPVAATWRTTALRIGGEQKMEKATREAIADQVDEFLNTYLALNPKEGRSQ